MRLHSDLDEIVSGLAQPLLQSANELLDLREWAMRQENAGACIRTYFDFAAALSESNSTTQLTDLRDWLEHSLEIVVSDACCHQDLESLRFHLEDHEDLEAFCQRMMGTLREDRCHQTPQLHLEFRFVKDVARAA